MDLDRLEIALRPRNHWEAIDLGFSMARRWFMPLCQLWLVSAIPVGLLALLLTSEDLFWMFLALWWFKPMYEPPLMFWLSRAVFGEKPTVKTIVRQWWSIVRPQLFANLTWRRLSANRSFYMPVALLEGLHGKARGRRIAVLGRRQQAGTWLTIVGIHFETLLELTFLITLYYLIPEELHWFDGASVFLEPGPLDEWLQLLTWLAAMAIIAPFYVAGGFALYLHRRSELEAWDIEINFRRTVTHAQNGRHPGKTIVASAVLALILTIGQPQDLHAEINLSPEQAGKTVAQVLEDPKFGRMEEEKYWRYVGKKEETAEEPSEGWKAFFKFLYEVLKGFLKGFATVGEAILWILGLLTIAYLLYHFSRNSGWMQNLLPAQRAGRRKLPSELFGLDVRPESLPGDIAAEALRLARAGELRAALSLLYRGALVRLINEHQLDIPLSATEGECLALVQRQRGANEADYFQQLTRAWLITAYAHDTPEAAHIEQLCGQWQEVYGDVQR